MERNVVQPRFIVDVNVGRLGRWLRALGCDVLSPPDADDNALVRVALQDGRILLTRDTLLMRRRLVTSGVLKALLIRSDDYLLQLRQVVETLGLDTAKPFSRCLECNQPLLDLPRHQAQGQVPPYVFQTQEEFRQCPSCRRVYWRGTHWARMRQAIRTHAGVQEGSRQ
jgi:hypothetical protein